MPMNAIEKILARHSDQSVVGPGDVVMVEVDVTVQFDHARPDVLKIANPEKLVMVHDHVVPAPTVQAANNAKRLREFVDRFGIAELLPGGQARNLPRARGRTRLRSARSDSGQR